MAFEAPVAVVASAARTSSSNSTTQNAGTGKNLNLWLTTTAKTGTNPTMDVTVQWSLDGTNWLDQASADGMTQKVTGTSLPDNEFKTFTVKAPYYRVKWVFGGTATPGFTFAVTTWLGS